MELNLKTISGGLTMITNQLVKDTNDGIQFIKNQDFKNEEKNKKILCIVLRVFAAGFMAFSAVKGFSFVGLALAGLTMPALVVLASSVTVFVLSRELFVITKNYSEPTYLSKVGLSSPGLINNTWLKPLWVQAFK